MSSKASPINCAEHAVKEIFPKIPLKYRKSQECFMVLLLNVKNAPIRRAFVSAVGTANAINVHPRDVFRDAIKYNAVSIIVAHNHPSGDLTASREDLELTRKLREGGKLLGINVLDHLILSPTGEYVSLQERGQM